MNYFLFFITPRAKNFRVAVNMENLKFLELLQDDLYVTFRGMISLSISQEISGGGRIYVPCVIKFYTEKSDVNNEFEVLEFLQKNSEHPEWFPKPYLAMKISDDEWLPKELDESDVWKMIVYQYYPGEVFPPFFPITEEGSKEVARTEIIEQLREIHRLGLIYGDVAIRNIISTPNRRILIDYGRTFSVDGRFPPMDYMVDYGEAPPTQEDDRNDLVKAFKDLD